MGGHKRGHSADHTAETLGPVPGGRTWLCHCPATAGGPEEGAAVTQPPSNLHLTCNHMQVFSVVSPAEGRASPCHHPQTGTEMIPSYTVSTLQQAVFTVMWKTTCQPCSHLSKQRFTKPNAKDTSIEQLQPPPPHHLTLNTAKDCQIQSEAMLTLIHCSSFCLPVSGRTSWHDEKSPDDRILPAGKYKQEKKSNARTCRTATKYKPCRNIWSNLKMSLGLLHT